MRAAILAATAFAGAFAGVFGVTLVYRGAPTIGDPVPKCDDAATVDTVKSLALKRLEGESGIYLLQGGVIWGQKELFFGSFIDRGSVGRGIKCAATIEVRGSGLSREVSTEYSVEPTTDGKIMVSARFMPN